jgi:uncharacterized membrane protein YphA (DoxX/SURF4 family)
MNLRNRKVIITLRTLLGLMFLFSGVTGLMAGASMQGVPEPMVVPFQTLWQTGIIPMIKITEIVAGLMLVMGFLPALALLFVSPICVGIIVVNSMIAPAYLPTGIAVTLVTAYLGYAYWDKYRAIFARS